MARRGFLPLGPWPLTWGSQDDRSPRILKASRRRLLRSKAGSGTLWQSAPESFLTADKFATERIRRRGPKGYRVVEGRSRISPG